MNPVESRDRIRFSSRPGMLLTMIGLAVGMGNVWLRWVVPLVLLAILAGWFLQH